MTKDYSSLFSQIIFYSFCFLFFLVPLAFSPVNYELFEFPKIILVYLLTIIITVSWLAKAIITGQFKIKRTPLDLPISLYLLSSLLSTVFSIHPHTSLWGYYSRFHGGLMSTLSYTLLYYAFVSNINRKKALFALYSLLFTAGLISAYGILERFGIDAKYWIQDVKNRVFSTLGQPNWLGAFITSLIFIPLGLALNLQNKLKKSLLFTLYSLLFLCLIFTNSKSAILAFFFSLLLFFLLIVKTQKAKLKTTSFIFLATLAVYLVLGSKTYSYLKKTPYWLKIFSQKTISQPAPPPPGKPFISESSDIRKVVWKGAVKIWKAYPVFGSGLETFGYAYYNFRPKEHNFLSEWDFLYNKAHNEFLNVLSCQGTIGIITYLFLIASFLFWFAKNFNSLMRQKNKNLLIALFAGWLTILITNFFGFSVVIIGILFYFIPAFSFILADLGKKQVFRFKINLPSNIFLILLFLFAGYCLLFTVNLWRADYYFAQGKGLYQQNQLTDSLASLQQAIKLNPNEAIFQSELAQAAAKLAVIYFQTNTSSQSAKIVNDLKTLSQEAAENSLRLNPVHLNLYKNQAKVYIFLSYIDPKFKQKALKPLLEAAKLSPTDPKIYYNLGILYLQNNNKKKAIEFLKKSVNLKPNYYKAKSQLEKLIK